MPVELDGVGYICVTCYEIIPKAQYASHRSRRDCHSPAMISMNLAKSQITTPAEPKSKQQPKGISSAIAAEIRQRDVRNSTRAANTIAAYSEALRKHNTDSTYYVNGKVMPLLDINRRIWNLSSLLIE